MLTVNVGRQRLSKSTTSSVPQDHDAEERGEVADDIPSNTEDREGEIEMQTLLSEPSGAIPAVHPLDRFYTGDSMLIEVDIYNDIKRHFALEPAAARTPSIDAERFRSVVRGLLGSRIRAPSNTG